ncbi:16S rRNA (adenine1518-N6/adenine1519-N6)-dimethyltransferase [Mycoplasmoides fastidiosum]|uniref:16S rRNA (Adenine1518-N6/adenine1519-N6)-dimethyltransferase n=1 Tax=Mycoplasmoides fastidiosum TaxID=92758 RepID=A0ABU0LYM4_9BACT|nr:16S rRNA (adenine(1518)-N(6)/adenine(1519)-N(6))-dimethyltransferase RsmA [Mycoplasmoides fastidiosum]MDQ0513814.1 16S rRNA (adenine1518-N6/adenine1519-N6)-dimethyltransferase [Mycoplasmoides fastidiosum]UUD37769.1 16S rRNA (adenine(1518)-N(6)/adenine(1519)-N(6))-dimethyltransferase RsmA [Mycoplasmoides fastidiosum]
MNQDQRTLKKLNLRPSKKLGQNFLTNVAISQKIATFVNVSHLTNLIEIGPGLGSITQHLNLQNKNYLGIELDKRLFEHLTKKFSLDKNIKFINDDFLVFPIKEHFLLSDQILLFGNIPYSISTKIIKKFLATSFLDEAIFMVQKEYFERLNAKVNQKNYSSFSVYIQTFCELEELLVVNKTNFFPQPEINSVVFKIKKRPNQIINQAEFSQFLLNCFKMKRKKITNNLIALFDSKQATETFLTKVGLDFNTRPDMISLEEYQNLFQQYQKIKK